MKIVALMAWSNGTISMDEKSVLDIEDALAAELIAQGICADASTYFGGGTGGGVLVVTDTEDTLDKTWQEIHDAMLVGGAVIIQNDAILTVSGCGATHGEFVVYTPHMVNHNASIYTASSADGYPVLQS